MFGLELAVAGMLELAQYNGKTLVCEPLGTPKINVTPSKSRISYDFSKTQDELNNMDIDTISPYGPGQETHVGGLMLGSMGTEHGVRFVQNTYHNLGKVCLYYDSIDVKIHIDPTIYIASDYPRGSCKHNAILDHEKKHVKIDRIIANKYSKRIARALSFALNKYGSAYGPYDISQMDAVQAKLQDYISQIVDTETQNMNEERRKLQQGIDTVEEYNRVQALCE